jgi:hypothetical protein
MRKSLLVGGKQNKSCEGSTKNHRSHDDPDHRFHLFFALPISITQRVLWHLRGKGSAFPSLLAIQLLLQLLLRCFFNQPFNRPRLACQLNANGGRATERAVNLAKIIRSNKQADCVTMITELR